MPLLATKLKNQVGVLNNNLKAVKLKNIIVNGQKRGCSGFFKNPDNELVVYIDTEESCYQPLKGMVLIRRAKDENDYRGELNQFVPVNQTAIWIERLLRNPTEVVK